jgi:small subunit ribosomal protein S16
MDSREPRDGKSIEEVGTYDPMIRDTDKRVTMKASRVDYWLGVGALPTENVKILIDKYKGKVPETRIEPRKVPAFFERLSAERKSVEPPAAPPPAPEAEAPAEAAQ